jgi:hypothetical protein
MTNVPLLPAGPLADAALSLVQSTEIKPITDHSLRGFYYARLTAEHEGEPHWV